LVYNVIVRKSVAELIEKVENKINGIEELKMKMDKTIDEFEK